MKTYRIDASLLKKGFCNRLVRHIVVDGYTSPLPYNDTQYGSALHKFLAEMALTNGNMQIAVSEAQKIFRKPCMVRAKKEHLTENHLIKTCFDYWQEFIQKDKSHELLMFMEKPLVEVKFELLMYKDELKQIYLVGTIDKVDKVKNGCICVGDFKTTSSWDRPKFLRQFRLNPQLKVYVWAIKQLGKLNPNGPFGHLVNQPIGAYIDGIFLKSKDETIFERSEVFIFKEAEFKTFEVMLINFVNELADRIHMGVDEPNGMLTGCCGGGSFYTCDFFNACSSPDEAARQHVLRKTFMQREYNPLTFGEEE